MNRKTAKIVAIIIIAAMVITSFSFVTVLPAFFGAAGGEGRIAYGAQQAGTVDKTRAPETGEKELDRQLALLKRYMMDLKEQYKDPLQYDALMQGAFEGVTKALEDPYSAYYRSEKDSRAFIENVSGEYSGIGIQILKTDQICKVEGVFGDTPAARAGILIGDVIITVDGTAADTLDAAGIAALLRGRAGTKVTVTVDRNGSLLSFTMIREAIRTSSVSSKMLEGSVGYIQISSFDNDTHTEFRKAREALRKEGARSLILDLRDNGGGVVSSALEVADQLIPKGTLTAFVRQGRTIETVSAAGTAGEQEPAVLLINGGSASASEILAAAVKGNKRAVLVGETTYGKGVAQIVTDAGNGHEAKISTFYFVGPGGETIHETGVDPDIRVAGGKAKGQELEEQYSGLAPMSEKKKTKKGETGLNAYGAQQRLRLLGYKVVPTGTFDEKTQDAVRQFQRSRGLYPYGVLDFTTLNALEQAAYQYVYGTGDGDAPLEKAMELLKK